MLSISGSVKDILPRHLFIFSLCVAPVSAMAQGFSGPGAWQGQPLSHIFAEPSAPGFWSRPARDRSMSCGAGSVRRSGQTVTADLRLEYGQNRIWNPWENRDDAVSLREYDGCLAAPTIVVSAGDELRLNMTNALPADSDSECNKPLNTPQCFNRQNLHVHGMHVSPLGHGDNVMHTVMPEGGTWQYLYAIPDNHPAGTFWYHAHQHGATALGVASGEEGALIVQGNRPYSDRWRHSGVADIDTVLHGRQGQRIADRIMLLQQIPYACFDDKANTTLHTDSDGRWSCPSGATGVVENYRAQIIGIAPPGSIPPDVWAVSDRFTLVNGQTQPVLHLQAGDVERWRMIAGGIQDTVNLQIVRARVTTSVTTSVATSGQVTTGRNHAPHLPAYARQGASDQGASEMTCDGDVVGQYEIAADGLTRREISEKDTNYLYPGQRSDILVPFSRPGLYCVIDQTGSTVNTIIPRSVRPEGKSPSLIAIADVSPSWSYGGYESEDALVRRTLTDGNSSLPPAVRQRLQSFNLSDFAYFAPGTPWGSDLSNATIAHHPTAFFGVMAMPLATGATLPPGQPLPDLNVNAMIGLIDNDLVTVQGTSYLSFNMTPEQVYQPHLGDVDEWRMASHLMGTGTLSVAHIFHVHVNPVEIMDIIDESTGGSIFDSYGKCRMQYRLSPAEGGTDTQYSPEYCDQRHVFRDSIFVKSGYQVIARTKYTDFTGNIIMHCHILEHEDQGMMSYFTIIDGKTRNSPTGSDGMSGM